MSDVSEYEQEQEQEETTVEWGNEEDEECQELE